MASISANQFAAQRRDLAGSRQPRDHEVILAQRQHGIARSQGARSDRPAAHPPHRAARRAAHWPACRASMASRSLLAARSAAVSVSRSRSAAAPPDSAPRPVRSVALRLAPVFARIQIPAIPRQAPAIGLRSSASEWSACSAASTGRQWAHALQRQVQHIGIAAPDRRRRRCAQSPGDRRPAPAPSDSPAHGTARRRAARPAHRHPGTPARTGAACPGSRAAKTHGPSGRGRADTTRRPSTGTPACAAPAAAAKASSMLP